MEKIQTNKYTGRMPRKKNLPKYPEELASLCQEIRAEEECSQEEMAKRLNISADTYANWENGRSQPTAENLIDLLKIRAKRRAINLKALFPWIK